MDTELRERLRRAVRELPLMEEIKMKTQRSIQDVVENLRSTYQQRKRHAHADKGEKIGQLVENVESFLGRIIPNSGLVQDLMGYITMPRFIKDGVRNTFSRLDD